MIALAESADINDDSTHQHGAAERIRTPDLLIPSLTASHVSRIGVAWSRWNRLHSGVLVAVSHRCRAASLVPFLCHRRSRGRRGTESGHRRSPHNSPIRTQVQDVAVQV
jgi:hypothetical protein